MQLESLNLIKPSEFDIKNVCFSDNNIAYKYSSETDSANNLANGLDDLIIITEPMTLSKFNTIQEKKNDKTLFDVLSQIDEFIKKQNSDYVYKNIVKTNTYTIKINNVNKHYKNIAFNEEEEDDNKFIQKIIKKIEHEHEDEQKGITNSVNFIKLSVDDNTEVFEDIYLKKMPRTDIKHENILKENTNASFVIKLKLWANSNEFSISLKCLQVIVPTHNGIGNILRKYYAFDNDIKQIVNCHDFDDKKIHISEDYDNASQKIRFFTYDDSPMIFKTDPIKLSYIIPCFHNAHEQVSCQYIKIWLDNLTQPNLKKFYDALQQIDSWVDIHRKKMFGDKNDKYQYSPLVSTSQTYENKHDKEYSKQYCKLFFDTKISQTQNNFNGKKEQSCIFKDGQIINDFESIKDLKGLLWKNPVRFIVYVEKMWIQKTKSPVTKKFSFGIKLKCCQIDICDDKFKNSTITIADDSDIVDDIDDCYDDNCYDVDDCCASYAEEICI